jgi:phage shock protein A
VTEKLEKYKERVAAMKENGELSAETQSLLSDLMDELAELNRSNKALRRVILKNGQGSAMSTRLRDALYE